MIVEYCEACETKVSPTWDHKQKADVFNSTENGDGPFCDTCWFFMRHIEALLDRVTYLEDRVLDRVTDLEDRVKGLIGAVHP